MYKKLRGQIFGINFDINLSLPNPLQAIYEFRLRRTCDSMTLRGEHDVGTFMSYALKYLPSGSFITFSFDVKDEYFVQFGNMDGNIVLDVPVWKGNAYEGKAKDLIKLLRLSGLTRKYIKDEFLKVESNVYYTCRKKKSLNKELKAHFGRDSDKASEVSLAIAESVFQINNPKAVYFQSDRFRSAR